MSAILSKCVAQLFETKCVRQAYAHCTPNKMNIKKPTDEKKNRPDRRAHNSSGWKCVQTIWTIYLLFDFLSCTQWTDARYGEPNVNSYDFCNSFGNYQHLKTSFGCATYREISNILLLSIVAIFK